jgi:hypothetical protein
LKRISIPLVALLAFVVAACSSGEASPSASASQPAASQVTSSEPSASEEPSESPDASGSAAAIPSFDLNGDPELAARFPDTVGGEALQVLSFRGDTMMAAGGVDPAFQEFLDSTGADLADVSVAFGGAASGGGTLSVAAFRVLGVPEDRLADEFISASEEAGDISGLEQTTISGKDVWTAQNPEDEAAGTAYIYVKDDTVYFLTGTEEQAAEILAALP